MEKADAFLTQNNIYTVYAAELFKLGGTEYQSNTAPSWTRADIAI